MAGVNVRNNRKKWMRVRHPAFLPNRSSQIMRTGLTVSNTGAAIAIRPPRTAIRRMDTKGQGTVSYF